jgi:hypothetical protein
LFLEAFSTRVEIWYGGAVLALGWLSCIFSISIAWLANPCFFFRLMLWKQRGKWSFFAALTTLVLASRSINFPGVPNDGGYAQVISWGPGFYIWLSSFIFLLIATFIRLISLTKTS